MRGSGFSSVLDPSCSPVSPLLASVQAFTYPVLRKYRPSHVLSLRRTYFRILQRPNLRQRRDVLSLEFTLKCGRSKVFCDVCSECTDVGTMAVCCLCRSVVHRQCYGGVLTTKAVWGEWLCDLCLACGLHELNPAKVACLLCESKLGALKFVQKFGWVHPGCVSYCDTVDFKDPSHETVVRMVTKPRKAMCVYCLKQSIWTARCSESGCDVAFHYRCGQSAGLRPFSKDGSVYMFCKPHRVDEAGVDSDGKALRKQFKFYRSLQPTAGEERPTSPMQLRSQFAVKPLPSTPPHSTVSTPPAASTPPRLKSAEKPHTVRAKRRAERPKTSKKQPKPVIPPRVIRPLPRPKEEQRVLSNELSELTGIHKPGTRKELETRLKAFLRQNKKREDYNFYDVSHLPELARVLGHGGKVEHSLLPSVVLEHSCVVTETYV